DTATQRVPPAVGSSVRRSLSPPQSLDRRGRRSSQRVLGLPSIGLMLLLLRRLRPSSRSHAGRAQAPSVGALPDRAPTAGGSRTAPAVQAAATGPGPAPGTSGAFPEPPAASAPVPLVTASASTSLIPSVIRSPARVSPKIGETCCLLRRCVMLARPQAESL